MINAKDAQQDNLQQGIPSATPCAYWALRGERAEVLPVKWHVFTDGAWEEPGEDHDGPPPPAGLGVAEITVSEDDSQQSIPIRQLTRDGGADAPGQGHVTWVCSAQVQTDPVAHDWIGATAHTNNTGELSALMVAVRHALQRPSQVGAEVIHSDSLYAINMTTGKWRPRVKRNMDMIAQLRVMWRTLVRRRPGEVRLEHVRSHVLTPGNEIADWLADRGAGGMRTSVQHARAWAARLVHVAGGMRGASTPRCGATHCGDTGEQPARGQLPCGESEGAQVRTPARPPRGDG